MKTLLLTYAIFFITLTIAQVPNPTLQPSEYWTKLYSAVYDFQSNGSIRYIVQDPSNPDKLCAILMAQEDSTSSGITGRYIFYSYSGDGGKNWAKGVVDSSTNYGFPCIATMNGIPVIAMHTNSQTGDRTHIFRDVSFGGNSFTQIPGFPGSNSYLQWLHVANSSNGNLIVAGTVSTLFSGQYSVYNGSIWTPLVLLPNTGGPSGQFSIEANSTGQVYISGVDYNSVSPPPTRLWISTNNGLNYILQSSTNAPPDLLYSGTDTLVSYIDGGRSGIYVGNEPHLVYCVYSSSTELLPTPSNTIWFKKTKIVHWSPSTGVDTVAGRYNMLDMTDTLTQSLVTPLCHPSMGYYNGYIYVIFTAYLRGNKQTVLDGSQVNAGEIFLTRSSDNGNTWSTPVNLTNTPFIEEKHPSAVRNFNLLTGDSVGIYYIRDMLAGGGIINAVWGKAPVYAIYKKVGSTVLGVNSDPVVIREYNLNQNYPNPFNPSTTISYTLQQASFVTLKVYNVLGEEVKTLVNEEQAIGYREIKFNAADLPSGVYFYTLLAGDFKDTKTMIFIK